MSDAYTPSPRADKIADWLEVAAIREDRGLGAAAQRELAVAAGVREIDLDLGRNTMVRRAAVLGSAYPFRTGSGIAAAPDVADFPWASMLLMSAESPMRLVIDLPRSAAMFEQITACALVHLYGGGTRSVRFGWPSDIGRPREFPDAVRWLAADMGVAIGSSYRPPYAKDGGVDVVAWRPFPDGRSGFPVTLVQCTLERDYAHKAGDVDVRVWAGWLRLDVDPTTALAVPEVVPAGEAWNALAARTVVLDRIRLASLIREETRMGYPLAGVRSWTASTVDAMRSR
ncbi:hypothetical protein [uncultured Cellulomonas sp.]|uniref:hypothetical protein n=1 Tax=uncultured Cellulomonas sp. TaxID=189682 RepID=UPI0028ECF0B3|nr:hypothetical protein [uncultured Cellulomonas sp.]